MFDRDTAVLMGGLVAIFAGAIALLFGFTWGLGAWQCSGYEQATGKPTRFVALDCYVQDGGQWYVWEEYKHRLIARGEMAKGQ